MFTGNEKGIFDQMHDEDVEFGPRESEYGRKKKFMDDLMRIRERSNFLQKKVGKIFEPSKKEQTGDAETEFSKECQKNNGIAMPHLTIGPESGD